MKKLFVVVSAIETSNKYPFNFGETRSSFTNEERFRQTLFTLQSIRSNYPDDHIIVLDTSTEKTEEYKSYMHFFRADYIAFKDIDPEGNKIVTTHPSINYCECYLLNSFFKSYKELIKQFDFVIKVTGRYVYPNFRDHFTRENLDKFFFKKPVAFEWNDGWRFDMIDRRGLQNNNVLYQYCTVVYGFGISNLNRMMDIYEAHNHVVEMTLPSGINYDVESLSYFLTRPYANKIIETDWQIMGFEGCHGKFMYY